MAGGCVARSIGNCWFSAGKDEFSVTCGVFGLFGGASAVSLLHDDPARGQSPVKLAGPRCSCWGPARRFTASFGVQRWRWRRG